MGTETQKQSALFKAPCHSRSRAGVQHGHYSSRALTHSSKPSCLPYSFSEKKKKKQKRFLLEGQDLLERAPPQNNILEVLYEVGVKAVALPGAWYPGWGNTSQGSRSMEDVTKIGKHWTLGYGMWVCATIPSSIRKQEAQTGPSLALKPGVSKSGKRSRCLGLSGYRLTAFLTNAQTPASPTKWRLALKFIYSKSLNTRSPRPCVQASGLHSAALSLKHSECGGWEWRCALRTTHTPNSKTWSPQNVKYFINNINIDCMFKCYI